MKDSFRRSRSAKQWIGGGIAFAVENIQVRDVARGLEWRAVDIRGKRLAERQNRKFGLAVHQVSARGVVKRLPDWVKAVAQSRLLRGSEECTKERSLSVSTDQPA